MLKHTPNSAGALRITSCSIVNFSTSIGTWAMSMFAQYMLAADHSPGHPRIQWGRSGQPGERSSPEGCKGRAVVSQHGSSGVCQGQDHDGC